MQIVSARLSLILLLLGVPVFGQVPNWARARKSNEVARTSKTQPQRRIVLDPADQRVLPEILEGNGFRTRFLLTNLDVKPVNYELLVYDDLGDPLELPFEELGLQTSVIGTIPPQQSVELKTTGRRPRLISAYGLLLTYDKPASDPQSRLTSDRIGITTTLMFDELEAPVPQVSESESEVTMPFDARGENTLIVDIVNSFPRDVSRVELVFRNLKGEVIVKESFVAEAFNKYSFFLPDDIPELEGKFGTLTITGSSALLSTVGFRLGLSGFSAILPLAVAPSTNPLAPSEAVNPAALPGVSTECFEWMGGLIFSNDGKYLGRISNSLYSLDSLANKFGPFGSPNEPTSIWNERGTFGSATGDFSAASANATKPPVLWIEGKPVALVTANAGLGKRITLSALAGCLNR